MLILFLWQLSQWQSLVLKNPLARLLSIFFLNTVGFFFIVKVVILLFLVVVVRSIECVIGKSVKGNDRCNREGGDNKRRGRRGRNIYKKEPVRYSREGLG